MLAKIISYIPAITGVLVIALVSWLNNRKNSSNKIFSILNLLIAAWLACLFIADTASSYQLAIWSLRLALFFATFVFLSFFIFSLVFPYKSNFNLKKIGIYLSPGVVIAFLSLTSLVVQTVSINEFGTQPDKIGVLYTFSDVAGVLYLLFGAAILLKKYGGATRLQKSQIKFVLLGLFIAGSVNILTGLIFTVFHIDSSLLYFGGFSLFIFSLFIAYTIVKHRFLDIRLIVARSAAYLLSLLVIVGMYGFAVFVASSTIFSSHDINVSRQLFYIAAAIITAVISPSVKRFFDKLTNNLFYRDAYDAQVFIDQLNKELVSNIDLESLLRKCSEIIETNLKPTFCNFGLKETAYSPQRVIGTAEKEFDKGDIDFVRHITPHIKQTVIVSDDREEGDELKEKLRKYDISVLARLATDMELEVEGLGYLIFGPKKSGNPYNKQDIKMIEIITNELVIAIQNALRFEEIEKFNVTLQERVDSATAELKRTNERLKELDETKDEFISMASHQLRTPLTSVKGYLSMVLEGDVGDVPKQQQKMLEQAFISSQRMVYLIADLLNVSRLKTGKFIIETKPTNLADVIEGEVNQLIDTAKARKLELKYDKPQDFPVLMLDETKIRQVVMNFIDNAIYYTPSGGKINVQLEDKGKTIEYRVVDNGIGVPKAERHHLFSKFYRAANAKKARPDGTGLGLFMAKKVILAQGGVVIFESKEDQGSTFGFSFEKEKILPISTEQDEKTDESDNTNN